MLVLSFISFLLVSSSAFSQDVPSLTWQYLDLGTHIGSGGHAVGDFDGNGYPELFLVTNYFSDIMAIEYTGVNYTTVDKLEIPDSAQDKSILSFAHLTTDADYGITILGDSSSASGEFLIHGLADRSLRGTGDSDYMPTSPYYAGQATLGQHGLGVFFTDRDSGTILFIAANKTHVSNFGFVSGTPGRGVVGRFTSTDRTQIAYDDGSIFEYRPLSQTFERVDGFAVEVATGLIAATDIDGDGLDEIISHWHSSIACFSALDFGLVWEASIDYSVHALRIGDADSDGIADILHGDDQWGSIHVLVPTNGFEFMTLDNPEHGVTDIVVADLNMDGVNEVMWGAGHTSTGSDHWFIVDPSPAGGEEIIWQSRDLDGPYNKYAFDPANPGSFVFASYESNSGYDGSVAVYVDARTMTPIWEKEVGDIFDPMQDMEIGYINGNPNPVLIVLSESYPGVGLYYYSLTDGTSFEETGELTGSGSTGRITIADFNSDGQMDIIAAGGDTINIFYNSDPTKPTLIAPGCNSPIIDLAVADTNADSTKDVFAVTEAYDIWQFNTDTGHLIPLAVTDVPTSLETISGERIAYGTASGRIRILNDDEFVSETLCSTGPIWHLEHMVGEDLGSDVLLFSCDDAVGKFDVADNTVIFSKSPSSGISSPGRLTGIQTLGGGSKYLFGHRESVELYEL